MISFATVPKVVCVDLASVFFLWFCAATTVLREYEGDSGSVGEEVIWRIEVVVDVPYAVVMVADYVAFELFGKSTCFETRERKSSMIYDCLSYCCFDWLQFDSSFLLANAFSLTSTSPALLLEA